MRRELDASQVVFDSRDAEGACGADLLDDLAGETFLPPAHGEDERQLQQDENGNACDDQGRPTHVDREKYDDCDEEARADDGEDDSTNGDFERGFEVFPFWWWGFAG